MRFYMLDGETMKADWFSDMIRLEAECGLEPYTPQMLSECIMLMNTIAAIDEKEELVGFVTLSISNVYTESGLYIVNLNVDKNHRRQGIGESLLRLGMKWYEQNGGTGLVTLDVTKTNLPAVRLYEKMGFVRTDIPSYNGPDDMVMKADPALLKDGRENDENSSGSQYRNADGKVYRVH